MKISKVTRTRAHKINLGNYENVVVGATVEGELEPGDDEDEMFKELDVILDDILDKPVQRALKSSSDAESDNSHVWDFYEIEGA